MSVQNQKPKVRFKYLLNQKSLFQDYFNLFFLLILSISIFFESENSKKSNFLIEQFPIIG